MSTNPILEELYAIREKLLEEHRGDLAAYLKAAAERAKNSGHPIADITPRKINRRTSPPVHDVAPQSPSTPAPR